MPHIAMKARRYHFVIRVWDNHAHLHKDHQVKPALEMNATWTRGRSIALVGIKFLALHNNQEFHFPLYTRHLPRNLRDRYRPNLCPDSHPEHSHLKPYYPKEIQPPQWKRYLYSTGDWRGNRTWCKYPERVAIPMGWRLSVKADIDANLPMPYVIRVKLLCENMEGYNRRVSSMSFTHPNTGNALSPLITVSDWDAEDYGSLVWVSTPLVTEVNRWKIKLKWEIWYYPQGQPQNKRYWVESNTHVIYATVGEPLSCGGGGEWQYPWYTILDKATEWAAGLISPQDVLSVITREVYDMPLFDYPETDEDWNRRLVPFASVSRHFIELDSDGDDTSTSLPGVIIYKPYPLLPHSNDLTTKYTPVPSAKAQCTDAASILIVLFRAIGVNATTLLIDDPFGPDGFETNDIDPIGAPGWMSTEWNYHHLGDLNTALPAGPLYDACLVLDAGGRTRLDVHGLSWSQYESRLWNGTGTFTIHGRYVPGIVQPYYHNQ